MGIDRRYDPNACRGGRKGSNNPHNIYRDAALKDPDFDPPTSSRSGPPKPRRRGLKPKPKPAPVPASMADVTPPS